MKNQKSDEPNFYDIGCQKNFESVFGITWWTYPFPFFVVGDPIGDGITWE